MLSPLIITTYCLYVLTLCLSPSQSADPRRDFRGGGLLALENLCFFRLRYPVQFESFSRKSYEAGFPMAAAFINVTVGPAAAAALAAAIPAAAVPRVAAAAAAHAAGVALERLFLWAHQQQLLAIVVKPDVVVGVAAAAMCSTC